MDLHCVGGGDSDEAISDPRGILDDARAQRGKSQGGPWQASGSNLTLGALA